MEITVQHGDIKKTLDTGSDDFMAQLVDLIEEVERQALERHGIDPESAGSASTEEQGDPLAGMDPDGDSSDPYEGAYAGSSEGRTPIEEMDPDKNRKSDNTGVYGGAIKT